MFAVYKISHKGIRRYVGFTDNLERRKKQHNYLCFKVGKKKLLYDNLRKDNCEIIHLEATHFFKTRIEAKRYEALLILTDYFSERLLWQKVPRISDM